MRYSIWLILAAVFALAACGSNKSEDAPTPVSPALQPSASVEIAPTPLPPLSPILRSPLQKPADSKPAQTSTPDTSEPTPTAEPNKVSLEEVRTIYAPDTSTPVPVAQTPTVIGQSVSPTPPIAAPETLEPTEARRILRSTLGQSWESAQDITLADVLGLFETGYILVTGQTPEQGGWSPLVLSDGEYIQYVTVRHPDDAGFRQATSYCCEVTGDGLQTVVNGDSSPGTVLTSLAHEAGHALQRIRSPSQNRYSRDSNVGAVREAQAYAFEAALIRALGDYGNVNVSNLPIGPKTDDYIDRWRVRWMDKENDLQFEHERGFLILWLVALADTSPGGASEQIASEMRMLDVETLFGLHQTLMSLNPRDMDSYVESLMENLSDSLNIISGTISIRATQFPSPGSVEDSHAPYVVP